MWRLKHLVAGLELCASDTEARTARTSKRYREITAREKRNARLLATDDKAAMERLEQSLRLLGNGSLRGDGPQRDDGKDLAAAALVRPRARRISSSEDSPWRPPSSPMGVARAACRRANARPSSIGSPVVVRRRQAPGMPRQLSSLNLFMASPERAPDSTGADDRSQLPLVQETPSINDIEIVT